MQGKGQECVRVDARPVGQPFARVSWTDLSPTLTSGIFEGLDVGLDRRGPVIWALYERRGAFPYSGAIQNVHVTPGQRAGEQ